MTILLGASAPAPTVLGFEHLPVAVADLDAAEVRFRALGFALKPGRPHDNGIRNAHAKFRDGSYIELITAPRSVDALTAAYRRYLAGGDGPAFLSLYVASMAGLRDRLTRFGARAEEEDVTFPDGPLAPFFFGTRARSPSDRPEHYAHANGAQSLERVWLAPADGTTARMFETLGARFAARKVCLPECGMAQVARLPEGELVLLGRPRNRPIVGATLRVGSLDQVRRALQAGGIAIAPGQALEQGGSIFVPPALANGLWLEFRPNRTRR